MFKAVINNKKPLIIPLFITHRGCPFRCAFCNQRTISGVNCTKPSDVKKTIEEYLGWSKKRERVELSFFGGSFTGLSIEEMSEYIDEVKPYLNSGDIHALRCSTRPDYISQEIVQFLKENKFDIVELGVQTLSNNLLLKMERGNTFESVKKANNLLKSNKINTVFQFITGYPDENEDDISFTLNNLKDSVPDQARIYPFVLLPNTKIAERVKNSESKEHAVKDIINRSARLYLELQQLSVSVIRVGLPQMADLKTAYPDNLGQVVVSEMLKLAFLNGEREFCLPKSWQTSVVLSKITNFADITFF